MREMGLGQGMEPRAVQAFSDSAFAVYLPYGLQPCKLSLCCFGVPNGVRTRVATLKEWSPRPLDDGDAAKRA